MDKRYLLLIILLLSVYLASAAEDVMLGAEKDRFALCSCSNVNNTLVIKNTGTNVTTYVLSAEGSAARFTSLVNPVNFTLKPNKQLKLVYNINPICGVQGSYDLFIRIKSQNVDKALKQLITVNRCSNVDVKLDKYSKTINPCDLVSYKINLTNTGFYTEQYSFNIEPLYNYLFTANNINLEPGHTAVLYLKLKPCLDYGTYNLTLITQTKNSGLTARTPLTLNIRPSYNFTVEKKTLCETGEAQIPFTIKNTANKEKTFWFESGDSLASVNVGSVRVPAGYSYTNYLNLTPTIDDVDKHNLSLTIIDSKIRSIEYALVEIKQCSSVDLSIEAEDGILCENTTFDVKVINKGNRTETINLSAAAPDFVSISEKAFSLEPGQEKTVGLIISQAQPQDFDVNVKAELESGFVKEDYVKISIKPKKECYNAELSAGNFGLYEQGQLKVTNKGLKTTTYSLSINSDWVTISSTEVTLSPGESGFAALTPSAGDRTGRFSFTITAASGDVSYTTNVMVGESPLLRKAKSAAHWLWLNIKQYFLYAVAGFVLLIIALIILLKLLSSENVTLAKVMTTIVLLAALVLVYYYRKAISPFFFGYINYFIAGASILVVIIILLTVAGRKKDEEEPEVTEEPEEEPEEKKPEVKEQKKEAPYLFGEEDIEEIEALPEFNTLSSFKYIVLSIVVIGIILLFFMDFVKPYLLAYWKYIALGIFILLAIISVLNLLSNKSTKLSKYIFTVLVIVALIAFVYLKYPSAGNVLSQVLNNAKISLGHIPEWVSLYLNYIIVGVVILIIIILFLRLSNDKEEVEKKETTEENGREEIKKEVKAGSKKAQKKAKKTIKKSKGKSRKLKK